MSNFLKHHSAVDLSGQRFGRLFALRPVGRAATGLRWYCLCSCGRSRVVVSIRLKSGKTRSCGCLQREAVSGNMIEYHKKKKKREYDTTIEEQRIAEEIEAIEDLAETREEIEMLRRRRTSFVPAIVAYLK